MAISFGLLSGLFSGLGGLFGDKSTASSTSTTSTTGSVTRDGDQLVQSGQQELSEPLLRTLEEVLGFSLTSDNYQKSTDALSDRLTQLEEQAAQPSFDVEQYTSDVVGRAASAAGIDLESQINQIMSNTGGSISGNSMNALLANKLRNQTAANLAGVEAEARATGEQIQQSREKQITEGITGLSDTVSAQMLGLISAVRGARQAGTQTTSEESYEESSEDKRTTSTGSQTTSSNPFSSFANLFSILGNAQKSAA